MKQPVIYGLEGLELTNQEQRFFQNSNPLGIILFARNIDNKSQVISLINSIKKLTHNNILILIDEEGGRVSRLKKIFPEAILTAKEIGKAYEINHKKGLKLLEESYQNIASNLKELHINTCCAPVCDLVFSNTHEVIGDRAFHHNPEITALLARKSAEILLKNNIIPIIKHIPGHGRAKADSHLELPIVTANKQELENNDFYVFKQLSDMPFAMTAHIKYTAFDNDNPATLSNHMINYIKDNMGFKGMIMTDDLSMKALSGSTTEKTLKSLDAGCDIILHCNGNMDEMIEINNVINNKVLAAEKYNILKKYI